MRTTSHSRPIPIGHDGRGTRPSSREGVVTGVNGPGGPDASPWPGLEVARTPLVGVLYAMMRATGAEGIASRFSPTPVGEVPSGTAAALGGRVAAEGVAIDPAFAHPSQRGSAVDCGYRASIATGCVGRVPPPAAIIGELAASARP